MWMFYVKRPCWLAGKIIRNILKYMHRPYYNDHQWIIFVKPGLIWARWLQRRVAKVLSNLCILVKKKHKPTKCFAKPVSCVILLIEMFWVLFALNFSSFDGTMIFVWLCMFVLPLSCIHGNGSHVRKMAGSLDTILKVHILMMSRVEWLQRTTCPIYCLLKLDLLE
jgi:hypothetical protein